MELSEADDADPLLSAETKDKSASELENENKELVSQHKEIVKQTVSGLNKLISWYFWAGIVYFLSCDVIVLYARTMNGYDSVLMAICLFSSYLITGLSSLTYGIIGDKIHKFGILIVIALFVDVVCFTLEATTNSFYVLAISFAFGGQPTYTIITSMVGRLLPNYNAKQLNSLLSMYDGLAGLLTPFVAGIIAYFINYRAIFIVCAIGAILLFIIGLFYIPKLESHISTLQLNFFDNNNINQNSSYVITEYQFPLSKSKNRKNDIDEARDVAGNFIIKPEKFVNDDIMKYKSEKYAQWLLFLVILAESLLFGTETLTTAYYIVYASDMYDVSVIVSTAQLSVLALFFAFGVQAAAVLISKIQKESNQDNSINIHTIMFGSDNILMVSTLIVLAISSSMYLFLYTLDWGYGSDTTFNYLFFIFGSIMGFGFGHCYTCMMAINVNIRNPSIVGQTVGIQILLRSIIQAVSVLIVGILWDESPNYLWYINSILYSLAFLCLLIIVFLETIHSSFHLWTPYPK